MLFSGPNISLHYCRFSLTLLMEQVMCEEAETYCAKTNIMEKKPIDLHFTYFKSRTLEQYIRPTIS